MKERFVLFEYDECWSGTLRVVVCHERFHEAEIAARLLRGDKSAVYEVQVDRPLRDVEAAKGVHFNRGRAGMLLGYDRSDPAPRIEFIDDADRVVPDA